MCQPEWLLCGGLDTVSRQKKPEAVQQYEAEVLREVLSRLPRESMVAGSWRVYHEQPGRNGGTLDSYCGPIAYAADVDLEEQLRHDFAPKYGGGAYTLRLYDADRKRMEGVPAIRVALPGEPKVGGVPVSEQAIDLAGVEAQQIKSLTNQQTLLMLQKNIERLSGDGSDPVKAAMAKVLESSVNGHGKEASPRELLELAMVAKALRDDGPKQSDAIDKAMAGIMQAVTGLVTAQAQMNGTMMQNLQGVVQTSLSMIQTVQSLGQQDPWIVALQMAPDILDRFGGALVNTVREVKQGYLEVQADQAGQALAHAGAQQPRSAGLPAPAPVAGAPARGRNEFVVAVYQNYRHRVPPDVTADQVQYFLSDQQLQGVLSGAPDDVLAFLEREGLKASFDKDGALRAYVRQVIVEIQELYRKAAEKEKKEGAPA